MAAAGAMEPLVALVRDGDAQGKANAGPARCRRWRPQASTAAVVCAGDRREGRTHTPTRTIAFMCRTFKTRATSTRARLRAARCAQQLRTTGAARRTSCRTTFRTRLRHDLHPPSILCNLTRPATLTPNRHPPSLSPSRPPQQPRIKMVNSSGHAAERPPTIIMESAPCTPWRTKTREPAGTFAVCVAWYHDVATSQMRYSSVSDSRPPAPPGRRRLRSSEHAACGRESCRAR